jgi:hypothetical protein
MSNNDLIVFSGKKRMGKLSSEARNDLPAKDFAEPAERKYPVEDASHAANAKARAKQMLNRGTISQSEYDKICAKADRKLAQ